MNRCWMKNTSKMARYNSMATRPNTYLRQNPASSARLAPATSATAIGPIISTALSITEFFFFLFTGPFFSPNTSYHPLLTPHIGLYFTRHHWIPFLPTWTHHYTPITFADDVEAGLHSDTFDLTGNITEGDARS